MNTLEVIKEKVMEEARIWETFNCKDIEEIIKGNLRTIDEKFAQITAGFVTNGYYLRRQYDEKMYEAEGYDSFEEYVKAVYGKSRSWAKRMMQINEKFSVGGNDPRIDSKYIEYSVSQLQEMLYLEEEQLEHITPNMTIKEIREVRAPEKKLNKPDQKHTEYLNAFARRFIACKHDWLLQDFQNRVMHVDKSPNEIKKHLGADHRTWYFATDNGAAHINLFDDYVQLWDERSVCLGDFDWFYLAAAIQRMWNIVAMENAQKNQETDTKMCDVAQVNESDAEKQIPGQMNVEDYPKLLPDQEGPDIDIDNDEDNAVIEQPEIVINPPESVMEDKENVIDAEYKEVAAENEETCCKKAVELDELTFSQIAIRDYLYEEERTLAEYEKVNSEDGGLPHNLMMRQRMLVKALRLLKKHERDIADQDNADEPEELFLKGKELMACARNSLSNLNCEIEHKAWKAALASSGHLKHYLELVVSKNTERSELPVLKNNDQRKEWLNNYKEWGLWYRDENIDVNYYKYDFSDGSRLVVAEYPKRRMYWKPNEFVDEHYYHLLEKNRTYYGSDKTFEQQYVHSTDSETYMVEFLKNIQKGEKK